MPAVSKVVASLSTLIWSDNRFQCILTCASGAGQSYSEDLLLPMAPLSTLGEKCTQNFQASQQDIPDRKMQSIFSSALHASVGKVVSSFGCNRSHPTASPAGTTE